MQVTDQCKVLDLHVKSYRFVTGVDVQREPFLLEVNNRETIAAIVVNNDTYCIQKRIEKFPQVCANLFEPVPV